MATLNDPKINNGLPEGMTLNDLEIGAIIEVKYDNTYKRSIGVIVDTKKDHIDSSGTFTLTVLTERLTWANMIRSTQIVRLIRGPSYFVAMLNLAHLSNISKT